MKWIIRTLAICPLLFSIIMLAAVRPAQSAGTSCSLNPGAPQCGSALQLAQSCLPPPGQVYCGYYNGECINCYDTMPYYCPPQAGWPRGSCHQTIESAQGTCGQAYAVCGKPVN